jgi:hypothetical protein
MRNAMLMFFMAVLGMIGGVAVADGPAARPTMQQLPEVASREAPPSARMLVDAREEFERRYPGILARGRTSAGATLISEQLVDAAIAEEDRDVKWLMLFEARRMAVASGNAATLDRAIVLASATFEFDAVEEEIRSLKEIPVRILSPRRAAAFAEVAERVAARADADGRRDLAASAAMLAARGWQRAGLIEPARRAETRHLELASPR